MAALVVQTGLQASRFQASAPASAFLVQRFSYGSSASDNVRPLKRPSLSSMKRGTGGRSSFSGIVCTLFGASGFIGNHVCNRLGKIGSQVIIPYRGDHYDLLRLRLHGDLGQILFLPFNLRDEESIYNAVKYSNVVINLIGRDWETKNFTHNDVNVDGAVRIARIAREAGVEKLIYISDLNAAEKPKGHILSGGSKHLATKWKGEEAVRKEFPEATIFRPSFVCGNNDTFMTLYTSPMRHTNFSAVSMWKKGDHTIKQPVYVFDLAEAIVKAIKDKDAIGNTYQAVGPKRYKLADLVDWFHAEMRRDSKPGDYWRKDIRYDPIFKIQCTISGMLPGWPMGGVHWDIIERESVTDVVNPKLPTLEDLGVKLTPMEDYVSWVLRPFRDLIYYDEELNEFDKPVPPSPVG